MPERHIVLVHGGAWDIPADLIEPHRLGTEAARERAVTLLAGGARPLDAVTAALEVMENDPVFDAGTGSFLNENGEVELDASVMEGATLRAGAVAGVGSFANPGKIALAVLERTGHVLLAGAGAEAFALEEGFSKVPPRSLIHPREIKAFESWVAAGKPDARVFFSSRGSGSAAGAQPEKRGTVGVVIAAARAGGGYDLFCGTSTGGTPGKRAGRVGDVPLIGCGFYADNTGAAVSCTGWGEGLARVTAAAAVNERVRGGMHPQQATEETLELLFRRTGGRGGIIAVDGRGRMGAAHTTPEMAYAGPAQCRRLELSAN